jgi:hypothetical protein
MASSASSLTPPPSAQDLCYRGMWVDRSRSPSPNTPVQVIRVDDEATVRSSPTQFDRYNINNLRPQFTPADLILALHPQDNQKRYFLAEVCEKTNNEALAHSNFIKVLWVAQDGSKVLDFIPRYVRANAIMERILPFRDPKILENCQQSFFQIPETNTILVGHHFV